jgi:hypothetical protein
MKLVPIILIVTTIVLSSCDPGKRLVIKAADKKDVWVTVYATQKIVPGSHESDTNKVIIQVPSPDTTERHKKMFIYAIGTWPNEAITNLAANIDSIIINNTSGQLRLTTKAQIEAYLRKHRHGYASSILTIKAK